MRTSVALSGAARKMQARSRDRFVYQPVGRTCPIRLSIHKPTHTGELGMVEKGRGAHDTRAVATGGTTDSPIRIAACVHS